MRHGDAFLTSCICVLVSLFSFILNNVVTGCSIFERKTNAVQTEKKKEFVHLEPCQHTCYSSLQRKWTLGG